MITELECLVYLFWFLLTCFVFGYLKVWILLDIFVCSFKNVDNHKKHKWHNGQFCANQKKANLRNKCCRQVNPFPMNDLLTHHFPVNFKVMSFGEKDALTNWKKNPTTLSKKKVRNSNDVNCDPREPYFLHTCFFPRGSADLHFKICLFRIAECTFLLQEYNWKGILYRLNAELKIIVDAFSGNRPLKLRNDTISCVEDFYQWSKHFCCQACLPHFNPSRNKTSANKELCRIFSNDSHKWSYTTQ